MSHIAASSGIESLKTRLKRFSFLVSIKRSVWKLFDRRLGMTILNVFHTFPLFATCAGGSYRAKAKITVRTINQTIPFLSNLAASVGHRKIELTDIRNFSNSPEDFDAKKLKEYFDKYGSDKAGHHYHNLYAQILKNRSEIRTVFEIGLGTNNTDIASHMGAKGKPGASLRAFRDFLVNANIYGADIDKVILFKEDRIDTFFVDQTDPATFNDLDVAIPGDLDLVIDDGLHTVNANIETLKFGLSKVKVRGWVVIEDISSNTIPLWEVVAALLPADKYQRWPGPPR